MTQAALDYLASIGGSVWERMFAPSCAQRSATAQGTDQLWPGLEASTGKVATPRQPELRSEHSGMAADEQRFESDLHRSGMGDAGAGDGLRVALSGLGDAGVPNDGRSHDVGLLVEGWVAKAGPRLVEDGKRRCHYCALASWRDTTDASFPGHPVSSARTRSGRVLVKTDARQRQTMKARKATSGACSAHSPRSADRTVSDC